jgi:hypothetical protein
MEVTVFVLIASKKQSVSVFYSLKHCKLRQNVLFFIDSEEKEDAESVTTVTRRTARVVRQTSATEISSTRDSEIEVPIDRRRSAASVLAKTGSQSTSRSSLLRQAKLREVRMAFFTSDSSSSLMDGDDGRKGAYDTVLHLSASDERQQAAVFSRLENFIC